MTMQSREQRREAATRLPPAGRQAVTHAIRRAGQAGCWTGLLSGLRRRPVRVLLLARLDRVRPVRELLEVTR